MVLEIAAAIIGILAAAGKVAEILDPIVSTFKDVNRNIVAVLTEVNSSRIILSALQVYLEDLSASPHGRRELIKVNQLAATVMDGVLLFSELEELVLPFARPALSLQSRINWAWNDDKFATLVSRVQNFKSSITVMLNILQCDSDMEAFRARNELLRLTALLLQNNSELATRIARLEDYFTTASSFGHEPDSLITAKLSTQHHANTRLDHIYDTVTFAPIGTKAMVGHRNVSAGEKEGGTGTIYTFEFEKILFATRVYHAARRETSDVSFKSSEGLSHAWTGISDVSLSVLSSISVVALPLCPTDITNPQKYSFRPPTVGADLVQDCEGISELYRCDSISSDDSGQYHPLPDGRWIMSFHGNCPNCRHYHSSGQVTVTVTQDNVHVSRVECENCASIRADFGTRNGTTVSLLSTISSEPEAAGEGVRSSLSEVVVKTMEAQPRASKRFRSTLAVLKPSSDARSNISTKPDSIEKEARLSDIFSLMNTLAAQQRRDKSCMNMSGSTVIPMAISDVSTELSSSKARTRLSFRDIALLAQEAASRCPAQTTHKQLPLRLRFVLSSILRAKWRTVRRSNKTKRAQLGLYPGRRIANLDSSGAV